MIYDRMNQFKVFSHELNRANVALKNFGNGWAVRMDVAWSWGKRCHEHAGSIVGKEKWRNVSAGD
jgi:hypothetical protein